MIARSLDELIDEVFTEDEKEQWKASKISDEFIVFIIKYRKENNLSKSELAKIIGTSELEITNIEENKVEFNLIFVSKILRKLGMKLQIVENKEV